MSRGGSEAAPRALGQLLMRTTGRATARPRANPTGRPVLTSRSRRRRPCGRRCRSSRRRGDLAGASTRSAEHHGWRLRSRRFLVRPPRGRRGGRDRRDGRVLARSRSRTWHLPRQPRETPEVVVERHDCGAVLHGERRQMCVVDEVSTSSERTQQLTQPL